MLTKYLCCACRAENGVTLEWSPDGRHLLTATVAPRLRVDNGFQIYRRVLQAQSSQALPAVDSFRAFSKAFCTCSHSNFVSFSSVHDCSSVLQVRTREAAGWAHERLIQAVWRPTLEEASVFHCCKLQERS